MPRPTIDDQITFLYTRDLEASAAFYEGALQLPLALDQGTCRIYRIAARAWLGLCRRDDAPTGPDEAGTRHLIVTFVVDDVDGWYARLTGLGVVFERPPAFNPTYGIYHAFLRDPNGYRIEIQRFEDPRWAAAKGSGGGP